ncbi:phage tail sheath subtilisin-like domain-containing protein [Novacetimonas hansenii]|uniref:Tail sheath protein subtilisin-like domain-containing protein n=1 Tax=Novacetimonas hansenii TaxID=436 RepID=A0ABQ0SH90_NOVHA|nr:phage tail sheath subtilisin-like domain-containing protein [Novacetimonas hansenii]GAN84038.1 Mu-like prophage FluMu tail sheath protein [Novacetimonas hansenii JCM 7643]GBQ55845.1 hypothetical protein AA0243_1026 [Novacetimonas hansenii NRIC 0243]GEC64618.1 hypothetical protein GHA01_24670 [Novacetimonas hansenii]
MVDIASDFIIPGTFVTIQGTGTTTNTTNAVVIMAVNSQLVDGSGITFNVTSTDAITYKPASLTLNVGGTGYVVGDVITVNNVGTATVKTVDTNGVITAITPTLYTQALVSDMTATGITGTGGKGTGATFNATSTKIDSYAINTINIQNAGSGYHLGDKFTLNNATITVTSVNANSGVNGISFTTDGTGLASDPAGNGIAPSSTVTIDGPVNTLTYAGSLSNVQSIFGTQADITRAYERYIATDSVTAVYLITANSDSVADINAALAVIEETPFTVLVTPFTDSDQVQAIATFFDARYNYASELYGIHLSARTDTATNLLSYGATVNSKYTNVYGFAPGSVDDDIVKMAAVAAVVAPSLAADPSAPIQLELLNVAPSGNGFTITERNSIFNAGVAITKEDSAGDVYLERSRTTYQTDAAGTPDDTYQDTETLPTVSVCSETFRDTCNTVYFNTGMKIVDSSSVNTSITGKNTTTTAAIRATLIQIYAGLVSAGYCQDADTFDASVTVTLASKGVVSVYCPIILVEQLRQIQINIDFSF